MSAHPTRRQVLALIPLPGATVDALQREYTLHYHPDGATLTVFQQLHTQPVTAVVTNGSTGLTDVQMAQLPALEIVCAFGAGYENVDVAAAARRGIVVTHAPGANADTVADHALGFMLALARGYAPLTEAVRAGRWRSARDERPTLTGATLGIVGMGRIGRLIATRATAFSMETGYHTRHPHDAVAYRHYSDLTQLAAASDFLVIACPGGAATRHLVNRAVLRALGPAGYVVNISRGSVLDTSALIDALREGEIAGAGLDVIEGEPEVPAALLHCESVLLTPHVAGRSPASLTAQRDALLASLAQHFCGVPVEFAVHTP
ncbi:2-hydroxyacid dehydrogenase [Paraburkholderia saeva]|uniref:2-ketogluconate reductase n=1 Tax=Paraburkholderia saeva TaxID=2777537 RepID=A0A9N8S2G9_9BURK|nr:2-hydroxyacid dehydrogenase [Paraburkholderia saeva]CAG4922941.1 2-ketogluconate reductase [Paraburkholderia saeva]CAG4927777.1 2-ketogluconate reductase [Paraburkholderia saeva]